MKSGEIRIIPIPAQDILSYHPMVGNGYAVKYEYEHLQNEHLQN